MYFSVTDICASDLEKRIRMGSQLNTGRNLLDMTLRGIRNYTKVLAFCLHKWDENTIQPKDSGDTIDDVIEYVR